MLFLIALALAFSFAFFGGKTLHKYPFLFYSGAVLLTVGMSFLPSLNTRGLPVFVNTYVLGLFTRGAFATALWCVVMITGALPNGSAAMKKLMPIRGELSIFAAILTLGHNIGYGRTYFVMLFTDRSRMSDNQLLASFCTIAMLCIMIPLTVMSFPKIRRKMDPKKWKNIQKTAYLFYALIYIHVMLLTLPMAQAGRKGYTFSVFMYTLVFFGYGAFRIRKAVLKRDRYAKKIVESATLTFTVLMVSFVTFLAIPPKKALHETPHEVMANSPVVSTTSSSSAKSTSATTATASTAATSATQSETTSETSQTDSTETTPTESAEPETEAPTEPQYIYKNGEFSASAYGYDGDVHVTVTIENDVITGITGWSDESDGWYFDSASGQVIPAIIATQSADVDAYSGATYSSQAIMEAVRKALDSAKR